MFFLKIERKEKENQKLKALLEESNKQMERFKIFLIFYEKF